MKRSKSISRGSTPAPRSCQPRTLSRPKRRGSTKRSSLPDDSLRMACVCFATSASVRRPAGGPSCPSEQSIEPWRTRGRLRALVGPATRSALIFGAARLAEGATRFLVQVEDNVLAHAADGDDTAVFKCLRDRGCGGLQGLFFLAEPDGFDDVSGDAFGEAAGDGFDFGEFRHVLGTEHHLTTKDTEVHERKSGTARRSGSPAVHRTRYFFLNVSWSSSWNAFCNSSCVSIRIGTIPSIRAYRVACQRRHLTVSNGRLVVVSYEPAKHWMLTSAARTQTRTEVNTQAWSSVSV